MKGWKNLWGNTSFSNVEFISNIEKYYLKAVSFILKDKTNK